MQQPKLNIYKEETNISMLKVLETYKACANYYNSYGLNSAPNSTRPSRVSTERLSSAGSFWEERLTF
jgi:hypothetical protein